MTDPDLSQTTVMPAVDPFLPPDSYFPPAQADSASAGSTDPSTGYPVSDVPVLTSPAPASVTSAPGVPTLPDALAPTAGPPPSVVAAPLPLDAGEPESAPALPYPPPVSTQWGPGRFTAWQPAPAAEPEQPPLASHPGAITCPECGAPGHVDPARRDAEDFCPHCDFPLFWARDQIVLAEPVDAGDDSLRRLPGALGLQVIASVPCPHCNELNLPSAQLCARCGLSMHVLPTPPPPPPLAPSPPVERHLPLPDEDDEPERMWLWWAVLIGVFLIAAVALVIAQHWY